MTFPTPFPFASEKYKADIEQFYSVAFAPAMLTGAMMLEGYNIWWKMALGLGREIDTVATQAKSSVMVDVVPELDAAMDGALTSADFDVLDQEEAAAATEDAAARKRAKASRNKEPR